MIKSILLSNPMGYDINLVLEDPYEIGIAVINITGLGYPKVSVQNRSIAFSDVSLYQNSTIETRNIVLTLRVIGNTSAESSRHVIYNVLVIGMPLYVEIVTDTKIVHIVGYIETVEPDIFSQEEQLQVSIVCPDPYFYTGSKITYVSKRINTIKNFQFSKEQYNNWFDITDMPQRGKPVSTISDRDYQQNKNISLDIWSRFDNPKGFTLGINTIKLGVGYNRILIEYNVGSILIEGNLDLDEYNGSIYDNFFYNSKLIIQNDINDQKILKYSPDEIVDITNQCIINGDYPTFIKGLNNFKVTTYGIDYVETLNPMIINGVPRSVTYQSAYYEDKKWIIFVNDKATFVIMDIYIDKNHSYYKPIVSKYIKDENIVEDPLDTDRWIFTHRIKLYKANGSEKPSSDETFMYTLEDDKSMSYQFGMARNTDENSLLQNYEWVYEKTFWYGITCTATDKITKVQTRINIDIIKSNIIEGYLYYALFEIFGGPPTWEKRIKTTCYVKKKNNDNQIYQVAEYINTNKNIEMSIEIDEFFEGL